MNIFIENRIISQEIYNIIKCNLTLSKNNCLYHDDKFYIQYPNIYKQLLNIVDNNNNFMSTNLLLKLIILNKYLNKCKTCNKQFTARETISGKQYCSAKCASNDLELVQRRQITFQKKYRSCV